MLIKSIRFPLPLSLQLPGATDEVLSSSMSKLPSYPAPSCIPTGQGHLSTLWGIAQVLGRSLSCSLAPSYLRSLLLLTRPLGKQALLSRSPSTPPRAIRAASAVPRLPVLESQGPAGVGAETEGSVPTS